MIDQLEDDLHNPAHISVTADVDDRSKVGPGSHIWHLAQVREYVQIGSGCSIGRGAYIGPGVIIGRNCKVQNYALVYEPALIEDGVFVGPGVVFTNDTYPRATTVDGRVKTTDDWTAVGVTVRTGASIGAHAVCVAPITIGRWAMVAAGSIVTRNVPDYAMVVGSPARRTGWVGRDGKPLSDAGEGVFVSLSTGEEYREHEGVLAPL